MILVALLAFVCVLIPVFVFDEHPSTKTHRPVCEDPWVVAIRCQLYADTMSRGKPR